MIEYGFLENSAKFCSNRILEVKVEKAVDY